MWSALACLLLLNFPAAQAGGLEIVNPRGTYGYLGAKRPPIGVLPGDVFYIAFDIKGLKTDAKGKASYSLLMEVLDDKGQLYFKEGPQNGVAQNFLGGDLFPCAAHLEVPAKTPPGFYTLRITLTDRTDKSKAVFERKGKVLPKEFGLVRVGLFSDPAGLVPAAPVSVVGGTLHLQFSMIGFQKDKATKKPDIHLSLRVLDDKGKPTQPEPLEGNVTGAVPDGVATIPMHFAMSMNRVGQFQVELTATDKLSGKKTKLTMPLKVTTVE